MVGATDTTTTTVEWTMAELLKHPEAMNKVQEELTQVVGLNNMVEESHSSKLTYLNAVIKETLLESTRSKFPNCLRCSRELGDEPSQERRPDSLIKRKGAHTPSLTRNWRIVEKASLLRLSYKDLTRSL